MLFSFIDQHFPAGICEYFSSVLGQPCTDASFVFLSSGFGEFETGLLFEKRLGIEFEVLICNPASLSAGLNSAEPLANHTAYIK